MRMDPFQTYKCYLALRLHFTTDNYDIIKQQGRVKASQESFLKRRDLYSITKISKSYNDEEIVNFLVSNFVSGDKWGGVFDADSKERYMSWKKKIESMTYNFKNEVQQLIDDMHIDSFDPEVIFAVKKQEHPYILKSYLSKRLSIETLTILNKLFQFSKKFDAELDDQVVWPDVSRMIKKYSPFLRIDKEKYNGIISGL